MLCFGAVEFTAGYIIRAYAAFGHLDDLGLLIAHSVLTYVAAPVYAAAGYFILGRMLFYIPYLSPIHPGRVVTTFIGLDLVIGILVGTAASRVVRWDEPKEVQLGTDLLRAAMVLQFACFVGFVAIIVVFQRRCLRMGVFSRKIKMLICTLYGASALIILRSVFRIVEYFLPKSNKTLKVNEWPFYVFEATILLVLSVIFNVYHPAKYLPKSEKIYLAKDGVTEIEGPGYKDERGWIVSLVDPFDVVGIMNGRDKKTRFWDDGQNTELVQNTEQKQVVEIPRDNASNA